jgi:hypothetical protein
MLGRTGKSTSARRAAGTEREKSWHDEKAKSEQDASTDEPEHRRWKYSARENLAAWNGTESWPAVTGTLLRGQEYLAAGKDLDGAKTNKTGARLRTAHLERSHKKRNPAPDSKNREEQISCAGIEAQTRTPHE